MNRHQRRASAKARKKTNRVEKTAGSFTAIHEAGHAVGRFLTANSMGIEEIDAIHHIEMHHFDTAPINSLAEGQVYMALPTTYGPLFSADLQAVSREVDRRFNDNARDEYVREVITAGKAAGVDVESWAAARILQNIAGPIAEGRAKRLPFETILTMPECQNDYVNIMWTSELAGFTDEQLDTAVADQ